MLRRNKDTEVDGKRILNLPPKITNMDPLQFEAEERAIYAAIEQRARVRVNKFIKQVSTSFLQNSISSADAPGYSPEAL